MYYSPFKHIIRHIFDNPSFNIRIKQQRNVNNKYENEYISVCCMANDNNFSSFRDLCLETVKRFIDYGWKCNFRLSNAKDILQDGSFLFLNLFFILSRFSVFEFCCTE